MGSKKGNSRQHHKQECADIPITLDSNITEESIFVFLSLLTWRQCWYARQYSALNFAIPQPLTASTTLTLHTSFIDPSRSFPSSAHSSWDLGKFVVCFSVREILFCIKAWSCLCLPGRDLCPFLSPLQLWNQWQQIRPLGFVLFSELPPRFWDPFLKNSA